jgi:hypothetical protein
VYAECTELQFYPLHVRKTWSVAVTEQDCSGPDTEEAVWLKERRSIKRVEKITFIGLPNPYSSRNIIGLLQRSGSKWAHELAVIM